MGITQTELGRRVGLTQGAIAKVAKNNPNGTSKLHTIACALRTTTAYLEGLTDDPDENAPLAPPPPTLQYVMLPVALPSENALARMFEGLLRTVDLTVPVDELARELATLLPTGLSQLKGLLRETEAAAPGSPAATSAALASAGREPPR